jgi:hypothetical protein
LKSIIGNPERRWNSTITKNGGSIVNRVRILVQDDELTHLRMMEE